MHSRVRVQKREHSLAKRHARSVVKRLAAVLEAEGERGEGQQGRGEGRRAGKGEIATTEREREERLRRGWKTGC